MASTNYINECKKMAYANRYGKIASGQILLTQSDKIQEFTINSGCYIDGNIIGSVYSKSLNAKLIDSLNVNLENMQVSAYAGVKYINDNDQEVTEYENLGSYVIEKPKDEQTENYSSFTAYDLLMTHLEDKYTTSLDYDNNTITISDVFVELCSNMGLREYSSTFLNSTIEVENNPFTNGETNRTVLNAICKVACSFVEIVDDSYVRLRWLSSSLDYTFQKSDYTNVEGGKTIYGPVNLLVIKSSFSDSENVSEEDTQSITQNGEHQIVITEDYFLNNATKRQQAITAIWNRVHNLTYVECNLLTNFGKPFLKVGSKIRIYTDTNTYFDSYILEHEFAFDGTFKSVIKCPVLTEQQIQTKQNVSLGERLTNTQIDVNKQGKKITQIVRSVGDNGEVTAASIMTAINNDTSQVDIQADKINLNGAVTANNNFKIKQDGSVEINQGNIEIINDNNSSTYNRVLIHSTDMKKLINLIPLLANIHYEYSDSGGNYEIDTQMSANTGFSHVVQKNGNLESSIFLRHGELKLSGDLQVGGNNSIFKNASTGNTASNNDLNNALQTGQYTFAHDSLNTPYTQNSSYDDYGIVITIANSLDSSIQYFWVYQIALGTAGGVYIRSSINQGNWSTWKKFTLV